MIQTKKFQKSPNLIINNKFNALSEKTIPKIENVKGQKNMVNLNTPRFQIEVAEPSTFKQKIHFEDIVKKMEQFFIDKKKKEEESLVKCQNELIKYYVQQEKVSENILEAQKMDLKIFMKNDVSKNEDIYLNSKPNKELSNKEMRKLLSKFSLFDLQNYLIAKKECKINSSELDMMKFLNKKKLKNIKENRRLTYDQIQDIMKQPIIKKILAQKEREIFNDFNKIKNSTSQKILRQVSVQNYYQDEGKLSKEIFLIQETKNFSTKKKLSQKIQPTNEVNPLLFNLRNRENQLKHLSLYKQILIQYNLRQLIKETNQLD